MPRTFHLPVQGCPSLPPLLPNIGILRLLNLPVLAHHRTCSTKSISGILFLSSARTNSVFRPYFKPSGTTTSSKYSRSEDLRPLLHSLSRSQPVQAVIETSAGISRRHAIV